MDISILKKLGLSERDARIYLVLLCLGPSSVRVIAKKAEMNRGSVYESLKWLRDEGLVSFYEKEDESQPSYILISGGGDGWLYLLEF